MLSVANRPSKHFMSDCGPLLKHVWACLAASSSPLARHFLDFWQPWIKRPWRRCERSFKQIWWREPPFASVGGLWDRFDQQYVVVDVDGTKQAARQRALPHLPSLPSLIVVLISSRLLVILFQEEDDMLLSMASTHQG